MKNLLQKETGLLSGSPNNRQLFKKAIGIMALCALVTLPRLGFSQATVTDPALTNPNYQANKLGQSTQIVNQKTVSATGTSGSRVAGTVSTNTGKNSGAASRTSGSCFVPTDASYTAVPRNDDGSYGPIALGFDFNLYGTTYTEVWINTNGNLTFDGPLAMYNPLGFPYDVPMVAGFWSDVDTNIGGQIFFKQTASSIIVTWDGVESYGSEGEFTNTFQIILTNGSDALLPPGRNVGLNHQNIEWAFGAASIFEPATVGINHGNEVDYVQVGLFLHNNNTYDGPGGNYDGLYYLNGLCSNFNVTNSGNIEPSSSNFPQNNTVTLKVGQSITINPQFIGPETNQTVVTTVNTNGMCGVTTALTNGSVATASITITGSACNAGTNIITITATDNGIPARTTVETITVNVISVCNTVLSVTKTDVACAGSATGSADLTVTGGTAPFTYSWSNGTISQDLVNVAAGTYTVTVTDAKNCTATTTVTIGTTANPAPAPAIAVARKGSNAYTGADVNTIFLGYGNQMVSLTASNPTSGATSYTWSPTAGLSNSSIANPLFAPTASGNYTFTVTATNEFGCSATKSVSITVVDARSGNDNEKVIICHGDHKISVSENAVSAHLAHGCTIGSCSSAARVNAGAMGSAGVLEAYPNPFSDRTKLQFSVSQDTRFRLEVLDVKGSVVQVSGQGNVKAGNLQTFELTAGKLPEGIYVVRLITDTEVKHLKVALKH